MGNLLNYVPSSPFGAGDTGVGAAAGGLQGGEFGFGGFGGGGEFTPSVAGGGIPYNVPTSPISVSPLPDITPLGGPATASGSVSAYLTPYGQAAQATPPAASPAAGVIPAGATVETVTPATAPTPYKYESIDELIKAQGLDKGTPGWFARNVLDPTKEFTKDYGPLLGMGATGAGVLKQLLQPGGVEALSPLQQEQLNLMRQQQQTAQQYMTGQVTPEMQQNLMNQTKARITAIKNKYAKLGMSGSTAENQDLAAAQAQATQQLGQMQAQMIQTGAQMMGLPAVAISRLTAQQDAQSAAFNAALARFVASMAGRPQDRPTP